MSVKKRRKVLLEAVDGMLAHNEEYAAIAKEAVAEGIPILTVRECLARALLAGM